jgi:hypothetical protein|tara:strand:+ start:1371 stop:1658 length:288 start_codon:yes stop_codon:yes gene_type:complete
MVLSLYSIANTKCGDDVDLDEKEFVEYLNENLYKFKLFDKYEIDVNISLNIKLLDDFENKFNNDYSQIFNSNKKKSKSYFNILKNIVKKNQTPIK